MESQRVQTAKESGIVTDLNDWASETAGDSRYPLDSGGESDSASNRLEFSWLVIRVPSEFARSSL